MIIYHGSNMKIEKIDLKKCKPFKDFGKGFYCTALREQAELIAKLKDSLISMLIEKKARKRKNT